MGAKVKTMEMGDSFAYPSKYMLSHLFVSSSTSKVLLECSVDIIILVFLATNGVTSAVAVFAIEKRDEEYISFLYILMIDDSLYVCGLCNNVGMQLTDNRYEVV